MAFTFDQLFAADPANPSNVAQNASIVIFAPGDPTMTPLAITDPDGQPLANPIQVNANGFGSAFAHATLDRVAWAGGSFTGFVTSYDGMKSEAVAARSAAEAAASNAAAAASAGVAGVAANADAAAASAAASATAAANSAALVGAPADTAIAAAVNGTGATKAALNATYVGLKQAAKNPDLLIVGNVSRDANQVITTADVLWPDGTAGTFTTDAIDPTGAISGYHITYGSPVTKTFTQPTITRNSSGAATIVPQIVVS